MSRRPAEPAPLSAREAAGLLQSVQFEVKRAIVGQDAAVEHVLTCLLAGGHCLLEGLPGLAKTLMVSTLATVVGGRFARIQFTPDLVPSDIVGTRIYRASTETFAVEHGPVFAHLVLADEINRAPAKVQSALLEVMAEGQVSIGGITHPVPQPFCVLATQNPIESEGVYPLPEAQRDRFLMKLSIGYPSPADEAEILRRMSVEAPVVNPVLTPDGLMALRRVVRAVYVDPAVADYVVRLVVATRDPATVGAADVAPYLACGVSPRASLGLVAAARARALLHGRAFTLPGDVSACVTEVFRHRLVLSYEALSDGVDADAVVARIAAAVPAPGAGVMHDRAVGE